MIFRCQGPGSVGIDIDTRGRERRNGGDEDNDVVVVVVVD